MEKNGLTEEEAHRYLQKRSMDNGTNMVETAYMVLQVCDPAFLKLYRMKVKIFARNKLFWKSLLNFISKTHFINEILQVKSK